MHRGKDTTHKTLEPCAIHVRGPNNAGRAVQTGETLLRYASEITEQKKCWKLFQTLQNNSQQHATVWANGRKV